VALSFRFEGDRLAAELPLHRFADHHGPIVLDVRFEYARGRFHEDSLRLFYTSPDRIPARLTGEARDFVRDGSLVVALEVDVDQRGFYRFDANLYGGDGRPVGWAAWKGDLDPGRESVDLSFYGKVLRDAGVPGPYTLGEPRGYRFLDGEFPDRELLPDAPMDYTTSAWPLDAFTDARYDDAHELHMVDLMLDDLERGIPVVAPPLPSGAPEPPRPPDDDTEPAVE
jgi:hypothetical protein